MIALKIIGAQDQRYLHGPRGIHAQETVGASGNPAVWGQALWGQAVWGNPVQSGDIYLLEDGLTSIRSMIGASGAVVNSATYTPFGQPEGSRLEDTPFGFTGEYTDETELLYLRAQYMNPTMGGFVSLDPFEGRHQQRIFYLNCSLTSQR